MDKKLKKILMSVEKPARYTGGEHNVPDMTKPCDVRFCLCFTDLYEVGMSNLGIAILYEGLNGAEGIVCERCFAPWVDFGAVLKKEGIPLMSIETAKPLKEFDVVGFSVPYEMSYSNILYMLDLAGIPFRSKDRGEEYPLIVGGGPASANPEPIADFFDVFFIGEGEESDLAFCETVKKHKGDKKRILKEAQKIDGCYVPALAAERDGVVVTPVKKATVKNLDQAVFPIKPLVPNIGIIHDRSVIELYRGCYAGCRFCQACFFYRPIRYRERDTVVGIAKALIKNTGHEELGLSSLSSGDYEDIHGVIADLQELSVRENVTLQMPSLRLDSFSAELLQSARKSSLTFAPEAGTQRLRNVINKNITDEDMNEAMRLAFQIGYQTVKLYFMLGLPTETDEDILGIVEIVERVRRLYISTTGKKSIFINVSAAMFIPKPLTPFQWVEQIDKEEMYRKQELLKKELFKIKGVHFSWHGADLSVLEGVFARGDRRLSYVVEDAYRAGSYFDGWTERFSAENWMNALEKNGLTTKEYTRARDLSEPLPWDFIDFGVTKAYLKREYEKSLSAEITPPCKYECNACGAQKHGACRFYQNGKKEEDAQ